MGISRHLADAHVAEVHKCTAHLVVSEDRRGLAPHRISRCARMGVVAIASENLG